jgi:succinate dehydrogenase / fumarate reductase, cytochrome b subunit
MNLLTHVWRTSLGKKYLMAVTGLGLSCFLVVHMLGNLQIFSGPAQINGYARLLKVSGEVLWGARLTLLLLAVVHITCAIRLALENRAARPVPYARPDLVVATYASRTVIVSGLIVAAFLAYYLLHFTAELKAINLTGQDFRSFQSQSRLGQPEHDVFKMMIVGFRQPLVAGFYILAMGLLCLHLRHGFQAWMQTLGLRNEAYRWWIDRLAVAGATLMFLGYASIPVAILVFGFGKEVVTAG